MKDRPNVIIILTDDQGYGDLGCMGAADLQTPYLDALAAKGVRFTSMYAASPVCSPSRAGLLTGRYPGNAGVRAILAGHRRASGPSPRSGAGCPCVRIFRAGPPGVLTTGRPWHRAFHRRRRTGGLYPRVGAGCPCARIFRASPLPRPGRLPPRPPEAMPCTAR